MKSENIITPLERAIEQGVTGKPVVTVVFSVSESSLPFLPIAASTPPFLHNDLLNTPSADEHLGAKHEKNIPDVREYDLNRKF